MKAFSVRWRSARLHREFELFAEEKVGGVILAAVEKSGGAAIWQAGTVWKCPGCGDRTLRTEEFVEGLRRAEEWLRDGREFPGLSPGPQAALEWMETVSARLLGCERDRVYIKDEGDDCTFARQTYISRI